VSTAEVGVESIELVVGVVDTESVGVGVGVGVGSGVPVGLTVAETAVSVDAGAVEVSAVGAVGSVLVGAAVSVETGAVEVSAVGAVGSVLVGAAVSVETGAVEVSATGAVGSVAVAVVSVAVSKRSVILPPLKSIVMSFAILVTQSPTTEDLGDKRGSAPHDGGQIP
jgi:hypothetical protein